MGMIPDLEAFSFTLESLYDDHFLFLSSIEEAFCLNIWRKSREGQLESEGDFEQFLIKLLKDSDLIEVLLRSTDTMAGFNWKTD